MPLRIPPHFSCRTVVYICFREKLFNIFVSCYSYQNYTSILKEFEEFSELEAHDFPEFSKFIHNQIFDTEAFWLQCNLLPAFKFKLMANFFVRLLLIPHSNTYLERMFSHINNMNEQTNLLKLQQCLQLSNSNHTFMIKMNYFNQLNNTLKHIITLLKINDNLIGLLI